MRISDWSSDVCSSDLPGIIWVVALLAMLLSLERLFLADFEDGSLEQLLLSPLPLELAVLAKVLAHWLTTGLPLIVAAPRSEERRGGTEWVSPCRSRWSRQN